MDAPSPDIVVDEDLVARLVAEQHPDLVARLELVAHGWDNAVYRLGDGLAVRLPRRRIAAALIENEQRWLPRYAARLPVPVPVPVRIGVPSAVFPYPWSIVPWFAGVSAADLDPVARRGFAPQLAGLVTALGEPAPADAPVSPFRGVPIAERDEVVRRRLGSGRIPRSRELLMVWAETSAAPAWTGPPLWLHGDLHPGNMVVEPATPQRGIRLAALVDFGDLTAGDPATDLATAWTTFDGEGRRVFRSELAGRYDDATWARARAWALAMGSAVAGTVTGDGPIARMGGHALAQVLRE